MLRYTFEHALVLLVGITVNLGRAHSDRTETNTIYFVLIPKSAAFATLQPHLE
jgi:hypothetical protein